MYKNRYSSYKEQVSQPESVGTYTERKYNFFSTSYIKELKDAGKLDNTECKLRNNGRNNV